MPAADGACPARLSDDPGIVFMGTPDYAVPSLGRLVEAGYRVQAVVTQPDRPRGRGRKALPPPVKEAARAFGLEVLQPEKVSEQPFRGKVGGLGPDLLVVVAFGQILTKDLLGIPSWGALNMHASLLPKYRGAAPIQWAILNDEKVTGISAMRMDEGLDTGPVLLQEEIPIGQEETAGELHDRMAVLSGDLLVRAIKGIGDGSLVERPQDGTKATYAPKIHRGMSVIDWGRTARSVSALIRALDPWPGAVTAANGKRLKLFSPKVADDRTTGLVPGRIAGFSREGVLIETGRGVVVVRELQAPGRKRLKAVDFARGFNLDEGMILGRG